MIETFRVRHKASESLHYAREVSNGIEVNLGRGEKNNRVTLSKSYFWMVYEVEEQWEERKRKKKREAA